MTKSDDFDDDESAVSSRRELDERMKAQRQAFVATKPRFESGSDEAAGGGAVQYQVTAKELEAYIAACVDLLRGSATWQYAEIDCTRLQVEGGVALLRQFPDVVHSITVNLNDCVLSDLRVDMIESDKRRSWSFTMDRVRATSVFFSNVHIGNLLARGSTFGWCRLLSVKTEYATLTRTTVRGALSVDGHSEISSLDLTDAVICGGLSLRLSLVLSAQLNHARIDRKFALESVFFFDPPELLGASLPPDISFESTWIALFEEDSIRKSKIDSQGYLELWDERLNPERAKSRTIDPRREVIVAARALRLAMKRAGAQWEEARFFAVEQRAERKDPSTHLTRVDRVTSWVYDSVSRYGTSSQRALTAFTAWNTAFGVLVWAVLELSPILRALDVPTGFGTTLGLRTDAIAANALLFQGNEAIGFALQSAFNPLALLNASPAIRINSLWLGVLSMIQSLGALGIATLALLAIRTRFHRGGSGGS